MSNEMTLAAARNLPANGDDNWAGGGAMTPYSGAPNGGAAAMKKVHRLLRGRYILAGVLAALIGGACGYVGWTIPQPLYRAEGLIEIRPYTTPTLSGNDRPMAMFTQFANKQVYLVKTSRVATIALKRDEWKEAFAPRPAPGSNADAVGAFLGGLDARYLRDNQLMVVSYDSPDPKIARGAVNAVMAAYQDFAKQDDVSDTKSKLDTANTRLNETRNKQKMNAEQIRSITSDAGGSEDLSPIMQQKLQTMAKMQEQVREVDLTIGLTEQSLKTGTETALGAEDFATVDRQMGDLVNGRDQLRREIENRKAAGGLGDNHPMIRTMRERLPVMEKQISDRLGELKKSMNLVVDSEGKTIPISPAVLASLRQRRSMLNKSLEDAKVEHRVLGERASSLGLLMQDRDQLKEDVRKETATAENLDYQIQMSGQIRPFSEASLPTAPAVDKRKQFAAAGFLGGAFVPVALLMLVGLFDSRYRFSEEATEPHGASMNGLTLLGILPNLPDRLSDPGQASVAAHCVHQIRTMLQINNTEDNRVFCVTSASSGDGKTSLTLALGLSFAASGSRTLLIDADLVGAGLTSRLNLNGPEGILEAMANRNLMDYVKTTDVADLSMLPVGLAQVHHAGIFSPQTVRRLLTDARKHFEVILIDTGPILGSIEATPICAGVDGVILTVARGQQRPLVEKALGHLRSIGAKIAGVVFNRAQAKDFEQSISGISMRSAARSATGGHNGYRPNTGPAGAFGPVAKAVHTAVRPGQG